MATKSKKLKKLKEYRITRIARIKRLEYSATEFVGDVMLKVVEKDKEVLGPLIGRQVTLETIIRVIDEEGEK